MKRLLDCTAAFFGLLLFSPVLSVTMLLVYRQDKHSPFYFSTRIGKGGIPFRMVKLRSMIINADSTGVVSTSDRDPRITSVGRFIRAFKLDELTQLWNVLKGDMSLVGPRPNVEAGVAVYTAEERRLLSVKPGITDFSSIVFADEGAILSNSTDPDGDYDQLIRPWKSRLGLAYIDHQSFVIDILLIGLTILAIVKRESALKGVQLILKKLNVDPAIIRVAGRQVPLYFAPPPGTDESPTSPTNSRTAYGNS